MTALGGVLSGFWGTIEEQVRLEALAGHDYSGAQDDRMAVMALGHRALDLATRYREALEREFDAWRHPPVDRRTADKSLSLMSEGELEIHLAGQHTTELLDHQFLHPLEQLDERLEMLAKALGVEGRRPNPVRPEAAVAAFVDLFGAEDLTRGLRPLVFNQFDKRLPEVLGDLYEKLNDLLEGAGFGFAPGGGGARAALRGRGGSGQPVAAGHAPAAVQGGAGGEGGWMPDGGVVEHLGAAAGAGPGVAAAPMAVPAGVPMAAQGFGGAAMGGVAGVVPAGGIGASIAGSALHAAAEGRPPRYRDVVREQLAQWRAAGAGGDDAPEPAADVIDLPPGAQVLRTEDLLNVAQILQGDDAAPYTEALAARDARELSRVMREAILGGVRQLGFDAEATHFSVDEEDAIDLVGMLFSSINDANDLEARARSFFGRLVVPYLKVALTDDSMFNRRSHPARRLLDVLTEACDGNAGETPQDRETLDRAERAVDRVVEEYDDDQAIFELASSELRDQLEQQRRRTELAEKRAAEAIHGRERLQEARLHASDLVASRLSERALTAPVAQFLDRDWRHHLTQAWLRDGPGTPRHHEAIALGDAMVQVDSDAAQARGRVVAEQLLALQVPLGECYSSCGMDATAARDAMARIISALGLPDAPRRVHQPEAMAVDAGDAADDACGLQLAGGTDTLDFDPEMAARMRRLRVGQGLRLVEDGGHETAARIAWISPLTGRFLVVNRRGARRMVVSPEELTALVASGRVLVRSTDAPFDEAMRQVWQNLNPKKKASGG